MIIYAVPKIHNYNYFVNYINYVININNVTFVNSAR